MSFYVYENWTHNRARIHRGTCGYCNNGQGTQATIQTAMASGSVPIPIKILRHA